VGPRSDLDPVEKRKIYCLCRESNSDCLFTQLAARSLPNALPLLSIPVPQGRAGADREPLNTADLSPLSYSGFRVLTLAQRGLHNICTVFHLNRSPSPAVSLRRSVRISEGTPAIVGFHSPSVQIPGLYIHLGFRSRHPLQFSFQQASCLSALCCAEKCGGLQYKRRES
jgi:hypothetical protein